MTEPVLWPLDDHTRAKHGVLRSYLLAWLAVMGQQAQKIARPGAEAPRLLVVDGFAGPGRYATGEEGSPLIMLKALLEHDAFERMGGVEFLYLFIEHDERRVVHLQEELDQIDLPSNVKVTLEHGEFEATFGEIVEDIHGREGRTLVPTFAFIDSFGYASTSVGRLLNIGEVFGTNARHSPGGGSQASRLRSHVKGSGHCSPRPWLDLTRIA